MSGPSLRWQPYETDKLQWRRVPYGRAAFCCGERSGFEPGEEAVIAIGVFDGLHVGHRALVAAAVREASSRGVPCVVVTFDPDPAELVENTAAHVGHRLLGTPDRVAGLIFAGATAVATLSFTAELAHTGAEEFVRDVLSSVVRPIAVHVGENFRFGSGGAGDVSLLTRLGKECGFDVHVHELVQHADARVSSTRVRELLRTGGLDEANALLGRCHFVRGVVEHGRGEGTSFGFPTANVRCASAACMPKEGVYACYVTCGERAWPAAANVGAPATFLSEDYGLIEANLLGFAGDLYGREVSVSFVRWLRGERRFSSLEELERVVLSNIAWVRENLGEGELEVGP